MALLPVSPGCLCPLEPGFFTYVSTICISRNTTGILARVLVQTYFRIVQLFQVPYIPLFNVEDRRRDQPLIPGTGDRTSSPLGPLFKQNKTKNASKQNYHNTARGKRQKENTRSYPGSNRGCRKPVARFCVKIRSPNH